MRQHPRYPEAVILETDEEAEAAERLARKATPKKTVLEPKAPAHVVKDKIRKEMH